MIAAGWSPSVRLFEAGACATAVISDDWEGLDTLFRPDVEILIPAGSQSTVAILESTTDEEARRIGCAARARILSAHTADRRAAELETYLRGAAETRFTNPPHERTDIGTEARGRTGTSHTRSKDTASR